MKFKNEQALAEFVDQRGGALWLVGGAVRDEIMGIDSEDRDYMITGLAVESLPFKKVAGSDFPVFLVDIGGKVSEVALARKEQKAGKGYHGFTFYTDPSVTVEQDLQRRDVTINAIAKNVLTGKIADPFNGIQDIENQKLRHISPAFGEDPLRVYRVARFAARFNFSVDPQTLLLMHSMKKELSALTVERIWKEVEKVLALENPRRFFEILNEVDVLDVHFPEIAALRVPDRHDGTAFNHTMNLVNFGISPKERFGLLVHDFGKGKTDKASHPAHHGHHELGVTEVANFCKRLKAPKKLEAFGKLCAAEHMKIKKADEMRPGKFVRWALQLNKNLDDLLRIAMLDAFHRIGVDFEAEARRFEKVKRLINLVRKVEKEVTGQTLLQEGVKQGKQFGEKLFQRRVAAFKKETGEN